MSQVSVGATQTAIARLSFSGISLAIYDKNAGYVTLESDFPLALSGYYWNTLKLVCDFDNSQYARLILNSRVYDISAYTPGLDAVGSDEYVDLSLKIIGAAAGSVTAYLDDVILTQNEP